MNELSWDHAPRYTRTKLDHDPRRIALVRVLMGLAGQNHLISSLSTFPMNLPEILSQRMAPTKFQHVQRRIATEKR